MRIAQWCSSNTGMASPLTDTQRAAYEAYFKKGGGFVGIGSAIETDPSWSFLTNALGTRSSGRTTVQTGTVKVFDRVHDATKVLPEYWDRTDDFYNFTVNVRGASHILSTRRRGSVRAAAAAATRSRASPAARWAPTTRSPSARTTWAGARSTRRSATRPRASTPTWSSTCAARSTGPPGQSDPVYSDCGATVRANYQQTKVSAPPNLDEPIGFDQFPDGRIVQTARQGQVRLHDPAKGQDAGHRELRGPEPADDDARSTPTRRTASTAARSTTTSRPNHWVYLYYSPQTVTERQALDGPGRHADHAEHERAELGRLADGVGSRTSATSSSRRFKFIDDAPGVPAHLDLSSEQQILRVSNNRQECCHVAGDIDFDKDNNLWMTTGDDTPAAGIDANGYGPFEDQLLDEQQTVRATNATGGTFTLTFKGQTTAPIAYNATRGADRHGARGALERRRQQHPDQRRPGQHGQRQRVLPPRAAAVQPGPDHRRRHALTGTIADAWRRRRRRRAAGTSGRPATTAARR